MNKKGQALIEFVMILPVLLLVVFALVDFGRIILCKMHLEGIMSDAIVLVDDGKKIREFLKEDSDYKINYSVESGKYKKLTLKVNLELITPGLKSILSNPYVVLVERSVINE